MIRNPFRNLDQKKLRHSSDALKTQNDYFKIVNKRIMIFSIVICLLFSIIVIRLAFLQIRGQEEYATKLASYATVTQTVQTPRGQIYDRNNKDVAKTVSALNITYFPKENATQKDKWELALKFSKQFKVNHDKFTLSDYQDAYFFLVEDKGQSLLKSGEETLTEDQKEALKRERLTIDKVKEKLTDEQLNAYAVYQAMVKAPSSQIKVILEDVDKEKASYLEEHKDEYPGFDVDMGGYKREYPYGTTFRDVLGNVSTNVQGIPAELREYYEALGYSMTDRVGLNGIEYQYESLLAGTRKVSQLNYDENGIAVFTEINSGKKGYDLHLTIDMDLQKEIDDILEKTLKNAQKDARRSKFKRVFVVLMDPDTGEVYAMSGKERLEDGTIINFASGAYKQPLVPGSIVKGATVYMGLTENAITGNTVFNDAPIKFKGSPVKSSYQNYGPVNAVTALAKSSNVFMWHTVMRMANVDYVYDGPLILNDYDGIIREMRTYYSMFGLGVKTGLDVPDEQTGFKGLTSEPSNFLDFSIGQYDSYTPIQIAQYVSTLANGGKKVQPKLVNTATDVNTDSVVFKNDTNVLSTIRGKEEDLDIVREGFRQCVVLGQCGSGLKKFDAAAKTGTAENPQENTTNASLIGWAPYEKPKVSFVCNAPDSDSNDGNNLAGNICSGEIVPSVLEEYFKKYPNK